MRAVFGHFPTGVAVVTCLGADGPRGLTVNAVCSVSLDPALVLVCFENDSRTLRLVRAERRFAINFLCGGQRALSQVFASKLPEPEKFYGVSWIEHRGLPLLEGVLAWVACDVVDLVSAGDHTIAVGEVTAMDHKDGDPLVFYRGAYRGLADVSDLNG